MLTRSTIVATAHLLTATCITGAPRTLVTQQRDSALGCIEQSLNLDASTGHYSSWQFSSVPARGMLRGTFVFADLRPTGYMRTGLVITLSGEQWARSLQFSSSRDRHLEAEYVGDPSRIVRFDRSPIAGDSAFVSLAWLVQDSIDIQVDSEHRRLPFPPHITNIAVYGSAGEFKAHRLLVCGPPA